MPRRLLERRYWERLADRRAKLAAGVAARWQTPNAPPFIDYWPEIPATFPEKLIFAELVRRRVNFYFAWYFGDLEITPDVKERYRPDFYLPDYKIIIEVYGTYWHTRPGQYEHDITRAFYLTASGYRLYILTDRQVIDSPEEAIDTIPELRVPTIRGDMHIVGDRPQDPTAAIRSRLTKWPRKLTTNWRKDRRRVRLTGYNYRISARRPLSPAKAIGPLFTGLSEELAAEAERYRVDYNRWLEQYKRWKASQKGG